MKILNEHKGFKSNQLVLDQNKTLARIIYIEIDEHMQTKYDKDIVITRLALIDEDGFEFAVCSSSIDVLTKLDLKIKFI